MAMDSGDKPLLIGRNHIRLNRVNSTNKYAADMIAKSKPTEGTVISASFQYEGRGQIGRFWESEAGMNITCSTVLRPLFLEASDQFQLNIAISLAVADLIEHYLTDLEVWIKWPNDIYVDDRKIAGILVQNTLKGKVIDATIVGTGININQTKFSGDIPNPTSLAIESSNSLELELVMAWWFRFLTKRYLQLKNGMQDSMKQEYLDKMYRRGVLSKYVRSGGDIFEGTVEGVDDSGKLIVSHANGTQESFGFREIGLVR